MNYKPKYKLKGPRKEISVSLPQLTEEMKLKHQFMYNNNIENNNEIDIENYDDDNIKIDADLKEIQEGSNLNSNNAILNENIQVHTFDSNNRIRYDQFFDQSDTEENKNNKSELKDDDEFQPNLTENETNGSESEYIEIDSSSDYTPQLAFEEQSLKKKKRRKPDRSLYSTQHIDDGDEFYYQVYILLFIYLYLY